MEASLLALFREEHKKAMGHLVLFACEKRAS